MSSSIRITFLLCLLLNCIKAQTTSDIVGAYTLRGATHYIKPDGTFALLGYATFITGKWKLEDGGVVKFIPEYAKERFYLYGRYNENIGDSTKIMLSNGFYDDETLIHLGELKTPVPEFKRIFKPGHRHISFPYVYSVKGKHTIISFAHFLPDDEKEGKAEIYSFQNKERYNDFIGYYWKDDRNYHPFNYFYKNGKLYSENGKFSEKADLKTVLRESEKELRDMVENPFVAFYSRQIYSTPLYHPYSGTSEDLKREYTFNKSKNAFLNTLNYEKDEEKSKDFDYNNMNILYEYFNLYHFSIQESIIKTDEVPVFISTYED